MPPRAPDSNVESKRAAGLREGYVDRELPAVSDDLPSQQATDRFESDEPQVDAAPPVAHTMAGLGYSKAASRFLIPQIADEPDSSAWPSKTAQSEGDPFHSAPSGVGIHDSAASGGDRGGAGGMSALTDPPSRASVSPSADRGSSHAEEVSDALRRFELMTEVGALQEGMVALLQERAEMQKALKKKDVEIRKLEEVGDSQEKALKEARSRQAYSQEQLNSAQERVRQLEEEQGNALTLVKNTMEADVELQRAVARRDQDITACKDQLNRAQEENTALKHSNQDLLFKMDHELQRLRAEAQKGTDRIIELQRLNDEKGSVIQQLSAKMYQAETASLSVNNAYSEVTQQVIARVQGLGFWAYCRSTTPTRK